MKCFIASEEIYNIINESGALMNVFCLILMNLLLCLYLSVIIVTFVELVQKFQSQLDGVMHSSNCKR